LTIQEERERLYAELRARKAEVEAELRMVKEMQEEQEAVRFFFF